MDSKPIDLEAADPCPPSGARSACSVNKLTLITLVIAVAGFAGTAFAADPPSFEPQALPAFTTTC